MSAAQAARTGAAALLVVSAYPASVALHEYLHAVTDWAQGSQEPVSVAYHRPWWLGGPGLGRAEATVSKAAPDHAWIIPVQFAFIAACLGGAFALATAKKGGP